MPVLSHPNLERAGTEEVLEYLVERFHPRLAVACSFQKEASVIMDMLLRIEPSARFFTLDTDVLFPETYETKARLEERFGIEVEVFRGISLERQAQLHGDELWNRDPDLCCSIRKVAPLQEALADADCWVAGLRREQSPARAHARKLDWDEKHGLWKANPLADWSDRDVWSYIAEHELPYNPLHDQGYASVGCTHCTLPADDRGGRWNGADKLECGLHG
ncbi:MAG: phosphoadenosine phosphosulfate reductase [Thermoleophilaceae bacterium]|jgi:phosphoadenosine phosphosulfate reductase|nr:phosphoadenosine phosphosulfate reductase [Thermoleophilaceae bacterium]